MHSASCWQQDYERLEQELEKGEYVRLLWRLRKVSSFLCRFDTWAHVVAFMRAGTSADSRKDKILQPIFRAHAQNGDHRWRTILLAIFWPGLQSIFWQKSGWDPDPHERWQRVVWAFFQVICRIDLKQRPQRLVQKVINDTVHHLYRDYERDWNEAALAPSMAPGLLEALADGVEHIDFAVFEARDAQEAEIARLRAHRDAGRISEADFLLLVGTRVYGQPLADYAREHGLNYEAAKKRRQRAEGSLSPHEKKSPEETDFLSR